MPEQAVLQDLLGAQRVAAVDQRDLRREVRQEQRLLDRGVPAAHDRDLLASVEEPVAGRAGRDAEPLEVLLGRQAEPLGLRAGGEDERVEGVARPAVGGGDEGPAREVERGDVVGDDLGAGLAGMGLHPAIRSGPMTEASPGQFSTSVVIVSCPPGWMPCTSTGSSMARAA